MTSRDRHFLKAMNPDFPFLFRVAKEGTAPFMIARFDWGEEQEQDISGWSKDEILAQMGKLVEKGASIPLKSPERDIILPAPIAMAEDDPPPNVNFSYRDGVDQPRVRPASDDPVWGEFEAWRSA